MLLIWAVAAPGLGRFATSLAGSGIVSRDQRWGGLPLLWQGQGLASLSTFVARSGIRRFATSVAK
jgi:hypothetical protein